ncbi:hypothetical protein AB3X82_11925 [Paraburkholderia phenoliruptrix]|uniref:Uncharacterized protein n=2 Tax=Paraburkholderia phenoliruptrix TaxID=252970 RepID=K0DMG6_9BURK|nr:hypothetical protein [Paraburkholderia phenoliruptrix]AFT84659.1 hypothetical protein BUPH_06808 [Paraburkholderia phenoliruptrix BR3459a]
MLNVAGLVSIVEGALGGTAPNTTDAVPRNEQLLFSCAHSLYCCPATVTVLTCACAVCTPKDASAVVAAIPINLEYLTIVPVFAKKSYPRE